MTFLDFSKNFIKAMTQACYFHCQWVSWNSFVMNKIRFKNIHFHFLTFSSKIQHFRLSSRSWVIFCSAPALILTLRLDDHGENIFANCECLWLRCDQDFFLKTDLSRKSPHDDASSLGAWVWPPPGLGPWWRHAKVNQHRVLSQILFHISADWWQNSDQTKQVYTKYVVTIS